MKKIFLLAIMAIALMASSSMVMAADNDVGNSGKSIVSPYWQFGGQGSSAEYTFIAITNPSISGNLSRAVTVTAIDTDGNTTAGGATTFTIPIGVTARVFIIATNHSAVNSLTVSGVNWVGTTTGSGKGMLLIEGAYPHFSASGNRLLAGTKNFANLLTTWGAVYYPSQSSGFAMDFAGDLGNSAGATIEVQ